MGETKKQRSPLTTLCYIEKDDSYLMLHRIKKKQSPSRKPNIWNRPGIT